MEIIMLDALIGTEPLLVCIQPNLVDPDAFVSFKFCLGDRFPDNRYFRKNKAIPVFFKFTLNLISNMKV